MRRWPGGAGRIGLLTACVARACVAQAAAAHRGTNGSRSHSIKRFALTQRPGNVPY
ncbi:hypothetical protein BSIN_5224 [Burkholderia singularis]|uniref:Uncharacterized protein n=1 Tax=Burkholderia singularis TaxID=1503053 RepID=A0A238HBV9_9BURK|nr:hypothetical protein BSIN_5224 [Burkholderia singularis]